jgi:hypothetical protein
MQRPSTASCFWAPIMPNLAEMTSEDIKTSVSLGAECSGTGVSYEVKAPDLNSRNHSANCDRIEEPLSGK